MRHEKASGMEGLDAAVENVKLLKQGGVWEVWQIMRLAGPQELTIQITDNPGEQEVTLTRKFGNET